MFVNTLEILDDLDWKAKHLQSRGYYTSMTVQELKEFLSANDEKPYEWKDKKSKKSNAPDPSDDDDAIP